MRIFTSDAPASEPPCPICGGTGYVRRDVPVGHPDFGRAIPCRCKVSDLQAKRMANLRELSNLGLLSRMTFETFTPEGYALSPMLSANLQHAYKRALEFADEPKGWLLFKGAYGCGKTHLAAAIANRLLERGYGVLFVVVPDLLDHLRTTYRPNSPVSYDERFDSVRTAPVLILDDLGTENLTPWAREKLFQIFNHRYNAKLPTIITTNRELEEIDQRVRSRLMDQEFCRVCHILAHDYRAGAQVQSDISSLNALSDKTFENFELREKELTANEAENLRYAVAMVQDYAQSPKGWLIITGSYGCGKTHLAAAAANYRAVSGFPALFIVAPDLLDHLRATFDPNSTVSYDKRFDEIRRAPLLILDDLGTQSSTAWAQEKLFQLLNYRYNAKLPTIITMSMTLDEFEQQAPRLFVRMLDQRLCLHVAIIAPSYHRARLRAESSAPRRPARRRPAGPESR
ncbi:MAG: ATP-binding protein [Chloroflexi bacterium]|nr:ATP-binding protein [Chloroflexota bacterium]